MSPRPTLTDKEYRHLYVEEHINNGLAFQIRALREIRGWSQTELGARTDLPQAVIAQFENPDYGRYTLAALKRLGDAFDVALVVRFVPFSAFNEWTDNITPERLAPLSYTEERRIVSAARQLTKKSRATE